MSQLVIKSQCPIILRVSSKGRSFDLPLEIKLTGTFKDLSLNDLGVEDTIVIESEDKIHLPIPGKDNVYLLWSEGTTSYKIGCSGRVSARMDDFKTGNPPEVNLICLACCPGGNKMEKILHAKYEKNRVSKMGRGNEWFRFKNNEINSVIQEYVRLRSLNKHYLNINIIQEDIKDEELLEENTPEEILLSIKSNVFTIPPNIKDIISPQFIEEFIKNTSRWVLAREHEDFLKKLPLCGYMTNKSSDVGKMCTQLAINMFEEDDPTKWRCDDIICVGKGKKYTLEISKINLSPFLATVSLLVCNQFKRIVGENTLHTLLKEKHLCKKKIIYTSDSYNEINVESLTDSFSPEFYLTRIEAGIKVEYTFYCTKYGKFTKERN
jgi:hypothetical protein